MNRISTFLTLVAILVCSAGAAGQQVPKGSLGDPAPSLEGLNFIKGSPVRFQSGAIYVVEFWATWCPPCRVTIPYLSELQKKFSEDKVTVIGITDESKVTVSPYMKQMGNKMVYTVAIDPNKAVSQAYQLPFGVTELPHAFVVDGQGRIAWHGHPLDGLKDVLEQMIAGTFDPIGYARIQAQKREDRKKAELLYRSYFETLRSRGVKAAREVGLKFLYSAPPDLLNALVWEVLTATEKTWRDLSLMVRMSARANLLTDNTDSSYLDTYAFALYNTDRIFQAIRYEKMAIDTAQGDTRRLVGLRNMLDYYMQLHQKQAKKTLVTRAAPAWEVTDWAALPAGKTSLEVTDFKGKVIYLSFFQSTCPASRSHSLPTMRKVRDQYATNDKVAFVAIQTVFEQEKTNTLAQGLQQLKTMGINVPCGRTEGKPVPDIMKRYAAKGTPWTIIIDRQGVVRYSDFLIEPEQAQLLIEELLKPAQ